MGTSAKNMLGWVISVMRRAEEAKVSVDISIQVLVPMTNNSPSNINAHLLLYYK